MTESLGEVSVDIEVYRRFAGTVSASSRLGVPAAGIFD